MKLLLMGDSTTAGSGSTFSAGAFGFGLKLLLRLDRVGRRWTYSNIQEDNRLNAASGTKYTMYNAGKSGNTTAEMRARWTTDIGNYIESGDFVCITGGINDINESRPIADIMTDLAYMAADATLRGAIVSLNTVSQSNLFDATKQAAVVTLNSEITSLASTNGYRCADFYTAFGGATNNYTLDGVHDNYAGSTIRANTLDLSGFSPASSWPTTRLFGVDGCTQCLVVQADGTLWDRVSNTSYNFSTTPTITSRSPNSGYNFAANGVYARVDHRFLNLSEGTIVVIHGQPGQSTTSYALDMNESNCPYMRMVVGAGLSAGSINNLSTSYSSTITTPTGEYAHGYSWKVGAGTIVRANNTTGTASANFPAATPSQPMTMTIGNSYTYTAPINGTIHAVALFDHKLSDTEWGILWPQMLAGVPSSGFVPEIIIS